MAEKTTSDGGEKRRERAEKLMGYVDLATMMAPKAVMGVAVAVGAHSPANNTDSTAQAPEPVQSKREAMQDLAGAYATHAEQRARRIIEQAERDMELENAVARQRQGPVEMPRNSDDVSLDNAPDTRLNAEEYVAQTRRLAEVLRVMKADGNTVEEVERVTSELRGRYAEIEKWPDARMFRNSTATVEEREQSLKAAREAKVEIKKGLRA